MNNQELIKLMLDYKKNSIEKYSKDEAKKTIQEALVAANGGSKVINRRTLRDNPMLFTIIEDLITKITVEGLNSNDFFNQFCEVRNLAEGDSIQFNIEDDQRLIVADVARGTQAIRRQRIGEQTSKSLTPVPHALKVYEEATHVLSGRADINVLINKITKALEDARIMDVYDTFFGITSSLLPGYDTSTTAGTYAEAELLALIQEVEAKNNGAGVYLMGTMNAARSIRASDGSDLGKNEIYNGGYASKWNGYDILGVKQRYKTGTTTYAFPDKKIYVIPSTMDRPVKQVFGGETYMKIGQIGDNQDLSTDVVAIQDWNTGFITGSYFGVYDFSTT